MYIEISFGYIPRNKLLGYRACICSALGDIAEQFLKCLYQFIFPVYKNSCQQLIFSVLIFFFFGLFGGYIIVLLCDLYICSQHLQVIPSLNF